MFNFHGWIAPRIFPFLKLTQCNKWVFHSFLGNRGSFHYIFLSTPWIRCALYSTVGIIWIDWMLTFRCCSLWCKCCWRDSKGHYSQSIHTCLLHVVLQIGWRGLGPLGRPVSVGGMTFYPSSLVNMGECRRHTGHLFAVSSRAARCLRRHTKCLFWSCSAFVSSHLLVCFPRKTCEAPLQWYRIMQARRVSGGMWWRFFHFNHFVGTKVNKQLWV